MRIAFAAILLFATITPAAEKDTRLYEMRIYYAADGKLDALLARFRDHTCKFFEKHGMTNIGYWVPIDNKDNKLVYVIAHKDKAASDASWKSLFADQDLQKVFRESEANGRLIKKFERFFLTATDYSPEVKLGSNGERVFELRTYTANAGTLEPLNDRFRKFTIKLFEKHGMTNLWYWNLAEGSKDADKMLIYFLAHKSVDAAKASFDSFRKDPDWVAARKNSEDKAGGSLTAKDGVKSEFMKATDFSPIK